MQQLVQHLYLHLGPPIQYHYRNAVFQLRFIHYFCMLRQEQDTIIHGVMVSGYNGSIVVNCTGSYSVTVSNGCGTSTSCVRFSFAVHIAASWWIQLSKTLTVVSEDGLNPGTISWNGRSKLNRPDYPGSFAGIVRNDVTDADGKVTRLSWIIVSNLLWVL